MFGDLAERTTDVRRTKRHYEGFEAQAPGPEILHHLLQPRDAVLTGAAGAGGGLKEAAGPPGSSSRTLAK